MSDKIRDEFKAAADAAGIKDGADRLALWAWWLKAWKAALAQQPAQAVPDYKVYAVIDSMGWDLDDQEKDDMYRLCRAMLAAAPAAPVAQEPVAWLSPATGDVWSDTKKKAAIESCGTPGSRIAEAYSTPLYAATNGAAEQPDPVAVPRETLEHWANDLALHGVGDIECAQQIDALLGKEGEA